MIHIAACSLMVSVTAVTLPSPHPSVVNMLIKKNWTLVCFLPILFFVAQVQHLGFLCTNLSLNLLQADADRIPFIFTTIGLCLSAFLTSALMVMLIVFVTCHSVSVSCPSIPSTFCWALYVCTRHFSITPFINPSFSLLFFCQFSLLANFGNLDPHWNHEERSVW